MSGWRNETRRRPFLFRGSCSSDKEFFMEPLDFSEFSDIMSIETSRRKAYDGFSPYRDVMSFVMLFILVMSFNSLPRLKRKKAVFEFRFSTQTSKLRLRCSYLHQKHTRFGGASPCRSVIINFNPALTAHRRHSSAPPDFICPRKEKSRSFSARANT